MPVSISQKNVLKNVRNLVESGLIAESQQEILEQVAEKFQVKVTRQIADAIEAQHPHDPLALQYLPDARELVITDTEMADPIGDHLHEPVKGIIHRYPDRVLLKPLHICPVYCRFCFRREDVGPENSPLSARELDAAIAYIAGHPEIWEVILSGGDPLMLSPRRLGDLIQRLEVIPHVATIRLHSRVPVADSNRIDDALIAALECDKAVWLAIHVNHARELNHAAREAIKRLNRAGIALISQTVLLKGVNDTADTLEELFRTLVSLRIKPYYLHHGDLAKGTSHFRTEIAKGQNMMQQLRGRLSGLAQPHYVLDIPGGFAKVPIEKSWIQMESDGIYQITDTHGRKHLYKEN